MIIDYYCYIDSEVDESEENADADETPDSEDEKADKDEVYPIEKRREIIEFWLNEGGKKRSFNRVQHKYRKVTSENLLRLWKSRLSRSNDIYQLKLTFMTF